MMLSRRLVIAILCITLIIPVVSVNAFAQRNICIVTDNTEELSTTINEDGLTVFGYFGEKSGYPVTVVVKDTEKSTIACFDQVMTQSEGYYSVCFPLDMNMLGKSYLVTAGSVADNNLYQKTTAYLPGTEKGTLLSALSDATDSDTGYGMVDFLNQYSEDVGVSLSAVQDLDEAERVYTALEKQQYSTLDAFRKAFRHEVKLQNQKRSLTRQIHVAPGGDNSNNGTLASPMATLKGALTYADYLIKTGSDENFEILIHGGKYKVASDIVIEKKSSELNTITIKNYNDENVILDGSREILGWELYRNNIYMARVSKGIDIDVLYEDNNMLTKARYPNKQETAENMLDEYLTAESSNNSKSKFLYNPADLPEMDSIKDLEVGIFSGGPDGYFMWQMNMIDVEEINSSENSVTLAHNTHYAIGTGSRYYLQGALELLDKPGEFYHDTEEGYVYYYPTDGSIEGKTISYPVVDNMITIANKDGSGISGINIRGITISGTKRSDKVYSNKNQSEGLLSGNGFLIRNAKDVSIKDCEMFSLGGNAICVDGNLSECIFSGNYIHHNGEAGIIIVGSEDKKIENSVIDNNYIHHQGLIIHSEPGIQIYANHSDGNVISHNRLHDLNRCGISIDRADGDNIIEYNDISRTCMGTDDSGMIYVSLTTGVTTIRHNYIHDSYSAGAYRGIYLDEGAHNSIVENNLVVRLDGKCYAGILAKGNDIQIINNYFVNCPNIRDAAITTYMNYETTERMIIEKNIIYNCTDLLYNHYMADESVQRLSSSDGNLFYNLSGNYNVKFAANKYTLELYRLFKGFEKNSKTEDPLFIGNLAGNDFRASYTSPAKTLGIEALELADMGLKPDFIYTDNDRKPVNVFVKPVGECLNRGFVEVSVGENIQLDTIIRNGNGHVISYGEVTYTISGTEGVASVSSDGYLAGLKQGIVRVKVNFRTDEGTAESEFDVVVLPNNDGGFLVSVNNLEIKNKSGEIINVLQAGKLDIKLSAISKEDTTAMMFVSYVSKDDKVRKYEATKEINLYKNTSFEIEGSIVIPENADGNIYIYIWNGIKNLTPLYRKIKVF